MCQGKAYWAEIVEIDGYGKFEGYAAIIIDIAWLKLEFEDSGVLNLNKLR